MIQLMTRHASRTDSKVPQIQERVPADVIERLRGTYVVVDCPAMGPEPEARITLKLGDRVKGSLRTRDRTVATARKLRVLEHLERLYAAARGGGSTLKHREIIALSGEVYALLRANFDDDPGSWEAWEAWKGFVRAAREGRIPTAPTITPAELADERAEAARLFGPDLTQGIDALPPSGDRAALEDRCGRLVWWVLSRHGLHVDRETRLRLLDAVAAACLDAGWALKRAARGDYTPDPAAARFPAFETRASGISLTDLFDRWQRETKPAGSTVTTWRGILTALARELGHKDAGRVTPEEVVRFKDSRVALGRSPKTINDSDLACLRALFRFGVANKLITANPAEGVKVSAKKRAGTAKLPYSDADIARLLVHAEKESLPYRRWLPLLLVTTGARVGELAQLWGDRVRVRDGVPVLVIEPAADGGSLKNEGSERTVPLHPAVIESGFLAFVRERGDGPLFYNRSRKDSARHASVGPRNHLSDWIRSLPGFDNDRISPAHGVRHWWKSAAVRAGVADSVADHLQGHAAASVAGRYRHFEIGTLAKAVAMVPIPGQGGVMDCEGGMPVTIVNCTTPDSTSE